MGPADRHADVPHPAAHRGVLAARGGHFGGTAIYVATMVPFLMLMPNLLLPRFHNASRRLVSSHPADPARFLPKHP